MNLSFSMLLEFPASVTCVTDIETMAFVAWSSFEQVKYLAL